MALAIASVTHSNFTTDATSHLVSMPTTVAVGDMLLAFIGQDGSASITTPSGWTSLSNAVQSSVARGAIYAKTALGTEGGTTVDFVSATAEQMAAQVYRITGALEVIGTGTSVNNGTASASANVGVATVDPPAVTAGWGADANLFITHVAMSGSQTVTSQPSGWGTPEKTNEGGSGQGANSAESFTSSLFSSNATEDPGVWTMSATGPITVSNTIVVRPRTVGVPANTVAGATVAAATQNLSIPAVAAGRIILITAHARRASSTLVPDDPTISDTSGVPLTWTPVFSPIPSIAGGNPGTKAQWWWAKSDGAAKTVTIGFANASNIFASVADFYIDSGLNPNFANQAFTGSAAGAVLTTTLPTLPTKGMNFLSFYGAGGSVSTIATGYTSLTFVTSTPYRTGYDMTAGADAVMGAAFPGDLLPVANIVAASTTAGRAKVWNGSAWVQKPAKVWSGSAWVQKPVKVWNGSAWV
jgi:hypothetical protein